MRDEKYVLTVGAALSKRLNVEVCVLQGAKYTEWRVGDKGFAVGPTPTSYPPRALLDALHKYFSPPMPVKLKRIDDEDDYPRSTKSAIHRKGAFRR